jgi:ribosomal protein S18 acetylase RimI-like enzyme
VQASQAILIRPFAFDDEPAVVQLWRDCELVRPYNDPRDDIALKTAFQPELFFVAALGPRVVGTVMAGFDGRRGWINYLGVAPDVRRAGVGRRLMEHAEAALRKLGCPKINLQVRSTNREVIEFYRRLGFAVDDVISMGKRLPAAAAAAAPARGRT